MSTHSPIRASYDRLIRDCAAISSGTLATLTGEVKYSVLDEIHFAFLAFTREALEHGCTFHAWIDAWETYVATDGDVTRVPVCEDCGVPMVWDAKWQTWACRQDCARPIPFEWNRPDERDDWYYLAHPGALM